MLGTQVLEHYKLCCMGGAGQCSEDQNVDWMANNTIQLHKISDENEDPIGKCIRTPKSYTVAKPLFPFFQVLRLQKAEIKDSGISDWQRKFQGSPKYRVWHERGWLLLAKFIGAISG